MVEESELRRTRDRVARNKRSSSRSGGSDNRRDSVVLFDADMFDWSDDAR